MPGRRVALTRFLRTPKGILTIILTALAMLAAPGQGSVRVLAGVATAILAAALPDALILRRMRHAWEYPSGAVLTGLIVAMVLSAQEPLFVFGCTSVIAILSKYIVRTRAANVFNPAALAVVVSAHLFGSGESWWGALPDMSLVALTVLVATGIFMADRVNKMPFVVSFLGGYFGLFTGAAFVGDPRRVAEIFRAPYVHAVLFFAFFILTDPPTSPVKYPRSDGRRRDRIGR